MKGIVFTEFLEMVEEKFGIEMIDAILDESALSSEGVYTAVGTYDFSEMVVLLTNLSEKTSIPIDDLLHEYGRYFFATLEQGHKDIFNYYKDAFAFLSSIETHIHVHVRKIYPDAELPYFDVKQHDESKLVLAYHSERAMANFGLGLIEKTIDYYNEPISVALEKLDDTGKKVLFTLIKE